MEKNNRKKKNPQEFEDNNSSFEKDQVFHMEYQCAIQIKNRYLRSNAEPKYKQTISSKTNAADSQNYNAWKLQKENH